MQTINHDLNRNLTTHRKNFSIVILFQILRKWIQNFEKSGKKTKQENTAAAAATITAIHNNNSESLRIDDVIFVYLSIIIIMHVESFLITWLYHIQIRFTYRINEYKWKLYTKLWENNSLDKRKNFGSFCMPYTIYHFWKLKKCTHVV